MGLGRFFEGILPWCGRFNYFGKILYLGVKITLKPLINW